MSASTRVPSMSAARGPSAATSSASTSFTPSDRPSGWRSARARRTLSTSTIRCPGPSVSGYTPPSTEHAPTRTHAAHDWLGSRHEAHCHRPHHCHRSRMNDRVCGINGCTIVNVTASQGAPTETTAGVPQTPSPRAVGWREAAPWPLPPSGHQRRQAAARAGVAVLADRARRFGRRCGGRCGERCAEGGGFASVRRGRGRQGEAGGDLAWRDSGEIWGDPGRSGEIWGDPGRLGTSPDPVACASESLGLVFRRGAGRRARPRPWLWPASGAGRAEASRRGGGGGGQSSE